MRQTPTSPQLARFALFEVDFRAGELRKEGRRIRLQEQPLQVLRMLLERPDELVTREELQQKLWPADTFVDFDHGLNSAVARLREALNDSAERPKYIETMARRGYRFIGKLEEIDAAAPSAQAAEGYVATAVKPRARAWIKSVTLLGGAGLVALVLIVYFLRHPAHSLAVNKTIDSVAVLPFANAVPNPDTDFLADGITQSAIDHLSRLGNLKVIAMGSVMGYRGRQGDPKQIGRDLGVRSVMTGTIAFHGDRMVVLAELVDASDGTHIWGEQYDRKVSDIMSLQEDIATEIATKLESRLSRQQEKLLRKRYTQDFEAYEMYLRGRYYWSRRTDPDVERGIAYFQKAIERDPNNALAHAGLADSYFVLAIAGAVPTGDAMPKAKAAALKALELDDSLAEAHTSLALIIASYDWNWSKAEAEYKRALELNPSYSIGHLYYATLLMYEARHSEALEQMKLAQELDPMSPAIATFIGRAYFYAGNNEEAIRQYRKMLESDPAIAMARSFLITALEQAGRFEEAVAEVKIQAAQLGRGPDQAEALARTYRAGGPAGYWRERIRQMRAEGEPQPGSGVETAAVYAKLGAKEEAFSVLNRAYEQHNMWLMTLKVDPRVDNLHSDPRFQALLTRVGLE